MDAKSPPADKDAIQQCHSTASSTIELLDDDVIDDDVGEEEEQHPNSPNSEKVLDTTRCSQEIYSDADGQIYVGTDAPLDNLTEQEKQKLAALAKKSSIWTRFRCGLYDRRASGYIGDPIPFTGQAGVLLFPNGKLHLVTCRHNVGSKEEGGIVYHTEQGHECHLADRFRAKVFLPNTGIVLTDADKVELRDGVDRNWGIDIAIGPQIPYTATCSPPSDPRGMIQDFFPKECPTTLDASALETFCNKVRPLTVVGRNFQYTVGLAVGIIVNNRGVKNPDAAFSPVRTVIPEVTEQHVTATFGRVGSVQIYSGQITHVGDKHIEYNVNTFKGCSGGIVIVMDPNHDHFLNALAVHSGYDQRLGGANGTNFGFKITVMEDYF